jgi:hypothetical protein
MTIEEETILREDEHTLVDAGETRSWIFQVFYRDYKGHGHFTSVFTNTGLNVDSVVLPQIYELKISGGVVVPHMGVATLSVANIAIDSSGTVRVRGAVAFDSDINYRIKLFTVL